MLGMGENTVKIIIEAKDRASAVITKVNTQMKTMGGATGKLKSSMGGLGSKMSALVTSMNPVAIAAGAAAIALATMGGAAIKASLEVEKASATIRVGTGATGDALTGLEESFKTVYTSVPTSTADAATAITDLNTRLGLTGEPLEALASQFLNLSRITSTDVSSAIPSATRVMHDFAVSTEEQSGALDYLFKVSQSTGIGMTQLGNSMTQYGSVMRQMGFDINESAALLGKFEKEGVNLQLVLGSLRMGLANFAKAGEEPVEALQRVVTEIQGMGSVADANLKAIEIFGSRAGPDMAAAIREGRFSIEELMATLEASSETINKAAADTMTLGDKWGLFKNKIMTALVPVGDVITNVLGSALSGLGTAFSVLQKVVSANIKTMLIPIKAVQALLEGLFAPILAALAPLKGSFDGISGSASKLNIIFKVFSDVVTIIMGAAKMLGTILGHLVANALTPLVAKLQEAGAMLGAFYEKLGPLKGAIEGVKGVVSGIAEGISNMAEGYKDAKPPIEEVTETLTTFGDKSTESTKAVAAAWALAIKSFQEGTGSYKEAIGGIEEKITKLTEEYMTATDKRKTAIEKEVELLKSEKDALEELKQTAEDALSSTAKETEEATQKMEEFKVTIGDTTIEFKGAAAEVVKNADAYEKLQKSAKTLIDLDWSTFTEFEEALPNIEAGILDMESSFVSLKDILEENIGSLDNVKESVMDIADIAAPFLEAGFLDGIKSIGSFAGSLKDAGSAINTFSSLQDVSIEGCINFSMHVHDMVSALEILEDQMEDLVPSFMEMDSLITDIADAFLYSGDKTTKFVDNFDSAIGEAKSILDSGGESFNDFRTIVDKAMEAGELTYMADFIKEGGGLFEDWKTVTVNNVEDVRRAMSGWLGNVKTEFKTTVGTITSGTTEVIKTYSDATGSIYNWALETYGVRIAQEELYAIMQAPPEEQAQWLDELMHREEALTFQMDKQTNALKAQTTQLSKITDALQPYLEFMRTLNELAALSTLSTEELNNGLNAINTTLINLGTSLSTFDLRPVMESLFGTKTAAGEFTGGVAKGFTDTMQDYQSEFGMLIDYISRLSFAIDSLVSSFKALENVSESVLSDETKLKDLFGEIVGIMGNFSKGMGEEGFAKTIATAMEMMIKSASPLISYFQKNNAEVKIFNSTLTTFATTIKNVVDAMDMLKRMSEMVLPTVTELEEGFGKVAVATSRFTEAVSTSFADVKTEMVELDKEWTKHKEGMDTLLESFGAATNTITTLSQEIITLSASLKELKDMSVLSMRDIDEALKAIPVFLDRFVDALRLNMYDIKESLKDLDVEWQKHAEDMKDTMPSYEASTDAIGKLVSSFLSLHSALKSLSEMGTISSTTFDKGFSSLIESISNFSVSLANNVDNLIYSLQKLRVVWVENEAVLFPLIRDFASITDNLYGVAHNTNRMAKEFGELNKNAGTLEKGFKSLIDFIETVVELTKEFYTTEAAAELATYIEDVGKVITSFVNLERELKGAMNKIQNAIGSAVANIEGKLSSLSNLVRSGYDSGANFLGAFIVGIYSMFGPLELALMRAAALVKAYLGVSSNTQMGPLARLTDWGPNIIRTISEGIENGMPTLNATFGSIAPSIGAGVGGSRTSNVNLYVTQNISDVSTADYANQGLAQVLSRHEVM